GDRLFCLFVLRIRESASGGEFLLGSEQILLGQAQRVLAFGAAGGERQFFGVGGRWRRIVGPVGGDSGFGPNQGGLGGRARLPREDLGAFCLLDCCFQLGFIDRNGRVPHLFVHGIAGRKLFDGGTQELSRRVVSPDGKSSLFATFAGELEDQLQFPVHRDIDE